MHLMALKTFKQVNLQIYEMSILLLFITAFLLILLRIPKAFGHLKNKHAFSYIPYQQF